jgi:hypothetical protein
MRPMIVVIVLNVSIGIEISVAVVVGLAFIVRDVRSQSTSSPPLHISTPHYQNDAPTVRHTPALFWPSTPHFA